MFQSTHPQRVRLMKQFNNILQKIVSIHAPTKGATQRHRATQQQIPVSIHAPTKGATDGCPCGTGEGVVSIHAPTKGATPMCRASVCLSSLFQSTHPQRVRHALQAVKSMPTKVSIHAPTKGATLHRCKGIVMQVCFNPRTHKGCDYVNINLNICHYVSIHAPTKGATLMVSVLLMI